MRENGTEFRMVAGRFAKFSAVCLMAGMLVSAGNVQAASSLTPSPAERQGKTMSATAVAAEDIDGIHKAILEYYIGGGGAANLEEFRKSFHPAATMYGYGGGTMSGGPIQNLFDLIGNAKPAPNLRGEITRLDITGGRIAQVKAEVYDWNGARYTDMFNLIKENDEWKVISKIYYAW